MLNQDSRLAAASDQLQSLSDSDLLALLAASENDPPLSNTGGHTRQISTDGGFQEAIQPEVTCHGKERYSAGTDWLNFSFKACVPGQVWPDLRASLNRAQEQAIESRSPVPWETPGGDLVAMYPNKPRNGGPMDWLLRWKGIAVSLKDAKVGAVGHPSGFVEIPGLPLMLYGHRDRYEAVLGLLAGMGYEDIQSNTPSRLDLCWDVANVGTEGFAERHDAGHYVSLAKKHQTRRKVDNGNETRQLEVGLNQGGAIYLIVYNKIDEMAGQGEGLKLEAMLRRWGGMLPDKASRAELRYRNTDKLKKAFGVHSVEDCFDRLPELAEYGFTRFYWQTASAVDRKNRNQGRSEMDQTWKRGLEAMMKFTGDPTRAYMPPPRERSEDAESLIKQGLGCLRQAYLRNAVSPTADGFAKWLRDINERLTVGNEKWFREQVALRDAIRARAKVDDADIPF